MIKLVLHQYCNDQISITLVLLSKCCRSTCRM